jgi:hypothetical protein
VLPPSLIPNKLKPFQLYFETFYLRHPKDIKQEGKDKAGYAYPFRLCYWHPGCGFFRNAACCDQFLYQ